MRRYKTKLIRERPVAPIEHGVINNRAVFRFTGTTTGSHKNQSNHPRFQVPLAKGTLPTLNCNRLLVVIVNELVKLKVVRLSFMTAFYLVSGTLQGRKSTSILLICSWWESTSVWQCFRSSQKKPDSVTLPFVCSSCFSIVALFCIVTPRHYGTFFLFALL